MDYQMIKTGKSVGLRLNEYNGKYSIISCREDKNGNVRDDFSYPSEWDKDKRTWGPAIKSRPHNVYLGDKETAVMVLEEWLSELTGQEHDIRPDSDPGPEPDSDIPF